MIHIGISKEQRLNSEHHHEAMISMTTSRKAKYWFHRPAYGVFDLRRGGSGGQEDVESVSGVSERDTED